MGMFGAIATEVTCKQILKEIQEVKSQYPSDSHTAKALDEVSKRVQAIHDNAKYE